MPPPSPDREVHRAVVLLESPREAAERARVYRRRTRRKPRDRVLRIVALLGSLFVHFAFLVGVVLGPVYVPPPLPDHPGDALQVRFIEKKKEEPPPPPPVRGTPPKKVGPVHRGSAVGAATRVAPAVPAESRPLPALPAVPAPAPLPVPSIEPPVIDAVSRTHVPVPAKVVAAPLPPVTLPRPAPAPDLQPVPLAGEPPTITLDTPPMAKPVPPKFQPEPPRRPQAEGNRPIMPPASLAMPEVPPQAPPKLAPPTLVLDARTPTSQAPASVVVARPEMAAAPPAPDLAPVPLPAQAAPQVDIAPRLTPPTPVVAVERPAIQAPALTVAAAEPELAAVPVAPRAPSLIERPTPPTVTAPQVATAAPKVAVTVARPELSVAEPELQAVPVAPRTPRLSEQPVAPSITAPELATAAPKVAVARPELSVAEPEPAKAATPAASAVAVPSAPSSASAAASPPAGPDVSTAPDATPQGRDDANPGASAEAKPVPLLVGRDGSIVLPAPAQEQGAPQGGGTTQGGSQPSAGNDALGRYIQLRPHGDTQIMEHRAPNIGYKPTRFAQDWAPDGESSIDTALRHAVEKTAVKHTFHLPRGVRIECVAMPLFPMALFGCHNPDPPPKPLEQAIYDRLNMPAASLAPPPPAPATVAPPAPAAPILLDNTVQCTNARMAGAPPPPGCPGAPVPPPRPVPAHSASSSWVPASDQFQPVH